jgi:hypothetical protein
MLLKEEDLMWYNFVFKDLVSRFLKVLGFGRFGIFGEIMTLVKVVSTYRMEKFVDEKKEASSR